MAFNITEDGIKDLLSKTPDLEESNGVRKIDDAKVFLEHERNSYLDMENKFVQLLSDIVERQRKREFQKSVFKAIFFGVVMLLFVALTITPIIVLLKFSPIVNNVSIIVALMASLAEMISAILILPNIIADYLFNKEEDKHSMEIIQDLRNYHDNRAKHFENKESKK